MGADAIKMNLHVGGLTAGAEDLVVYMAANRAGLRRAGFGLFCFDPAGHGPQAFAQALPDPVTDAAGLDAAAAALAARLAPDLRAATTGMVLSIADLAGPASDLILGRFHPQARQRARLVRKALGQGVDRLVLAVQPYEEIFHATWMRLAMDRAIEPFADYAPVLAEFHGGWADLGAALIEELELRELCVIAAPMGAPDMLDHIVPGLHLRQPVRPIAAPRITPGAVAMAQRCIAQGTRLQPGQRDRLVAFHARQPQVSPALGFSALALADLRGRYVADLDALAERAGVTMVGARELALAAE